MPAHTCDTIMTPFMLLCRGCCEEEQVSVPTKVNIRWRAVFAGFLATAICALVITPLLEHVGLNLKAGPVDALSMLSILTGGFVAGRFAGRFEGMHGAIVAVLYIAVIALGGTAIMEIGIANRYGLGALGKVDSWSNFGRDFFYFVAGALGGMWATPFNERDRQKESALLRSAVTTRVRPRASAPVAAESDTETVSPPETMEGAVTIQLPSTTRARKKQSTPSV